MGAIQVALNRTSVFLSNEYTMMDFKFDRLNAAAIAALALGVSACSVQPEATVLGDSVTVVNTFEDIVITDGVQTVYGMAGPENITDAVELPNFIGFYDIDISDNSLTMTLVDNSGATDRIIPADRYDRYYFEFDTSTITSATLDGLSELNEFATVQVLDPGFSLDAADLFGTGIPVPIEFENGGLLVEFGEGTDLTNLDVSATVNFTVANESVPEP